MTTLLPPPTAPPVQPAPPPQPKPAGVPVRRAVVVTLVAMLVAWLLNADDVLRHAQLLPFGWQRTAAVAVAEPVQRFSHDLLLDRPREALDRLFGHERSTTPAPVPTPTGGPIAVHFRTPTAADPLRVYLGGDSVAQVFGQSFKRVAGATGLVTATVQYVYSSGLTRPDYFNWPQRLAERLAGKPRPEVVVVLFGANDMQPIMTPVGPASVVSAAWRAEYRKRVAATMALLTHGGVDVYWVGQPVMRDPTLSARMDVVDAIFASEAAKHPGVTFVDSRPLFAGKDGRFSAYLPGADGRPVLMRAPDGVHLSPAGGDRLSNAVLDRINQHWPLGR